MALIACPKCQAQVSDKAANCPTCGGAISPAESKKLAPIHYTGGKLQAIGTVVIAGAIIAAVSGAWWGPALLFPGVIIMFIGRIWQ